MKKNKNKNTDGNTFMKPVSESKKKILRVKGEKKLLTKSKN